MEKSTWKTAFTKSLPIMGSYLFVSMAYGLVMQEAGYSYLWSLLTSFTVYTGAFQFVLATFLSSGASILTVALTALFMNSRQFFYGLTFVDDFRHMGKRYPYMICTMTDETYAINCSMLSTTERDPHDTEGKSLTSKLSDKQRRDIMFLVAIFCRSSWMIGAVLGGILGQLIPIQIEGIDFCMTALFVTILIDQWRSTKMHLPALIGGGCGLLLLFLIGADRFMLPALILVSGLLLILQRKIEPEEGTNHE